MKEEYEFSTAKRGPVTNSEGKTRITIMLDDEVIKAAYEYAESLGTGYQTVINHLLRQGLLSKTAHSLE
ncbi:CopG family transcriptional regulator [Pseudomonas brassicacearum]|nr:MULTISPECIES: BrnA antitoxin family protein [Pseudomonas]